MIEIPSPNEGERLSQYIARLLEDGTIKTTQIALAIKKFNTK